MSKKWTIEKHTTVDKSFRIFGPTDLEITVDFDDVNHTEVNKEAARLVALLNEHWGKE